MALTSDQADNLTDLGGVDRHPHFFRMWMPYVFQRIEFPGKKHAFLPLNRDYKPLGQLSGEHVDYDAHGLSHGVSFSRDPANFKDIWYNVHGNMLWLYDDSIKSRIDYFARLERLMAKSVPLLGKRR